MSSNESVSAAVEAFFVRFRNRFVYLHMTFFVFFMALMFVPLYLPDPVMGDNQYSHFALFANYVMWGLWFPLVLLSVIFTGRLWCGVMCPMGAASEWASRFGMQRPVPAWLRWEGTPHVSFFIITVLGQTIGVREHAQGVAVVFGGTFACAVLFGILFARGKRAWCRHACPIGLLLGLFSRLGIVQFEPKRKVTGIVRYTERGICPTLIDINRKDESRHCIECFKCVYPDSGGGLKMTFRPPGQEIEKIRQHNPNVMEVAFFFIGIGTALGGFLWLSLESYQNLREGLGTWALDRGQTWIGDVGPRWLMSVHPELGEVFNWLDFLLIAGYMLAWALGTAVVLGLASLAASFLAGEEKASGTLYSRFLELGYQFAPVCLVSLVIGLGTKLFTPLEFISADAPDVAKEILFVLGFLWSVHLGYRILGDQGLRPAKRLLPLLPGVAGSAATGVAWWVAIFGPIGGA